MLHKLRQRASGESGFTLIELLVVILIIGILAAIAIPSFLNQKGKANDADAKAIARTAQTAEETYFTDHQTYTDQAIGAGSSGALNQIEGTLVSPSTACASSSDPCSLQVTGSSDTGYTVSVESGATHNVFKITKSGTTVSRSCTVGDKGNMGGCEASSNTSGTTGTW